jgi:hypothetical protein
MENYLKFTKKVLLSIGIDFDGDNGRKIQLGILRYFTMILVFSAVLQSFLYFYIIDPLSYVSVTPITMVLFGIQSLVKHVTIICKQKKLEEIVNRARKFSENFIAEENVKSENFLIKVEKIFDRIFKMQMSCIWIFNILPFIDMLVKYFLNQPTVKKLPYEFWWPFDHNNYFIPTYLFQIYVGHVFMAVPIIMDQVFLLILAQIIAHFERIGDKVLRIVNLSRDTPTKTTENDLKTLVGNHVELSRLFDDLNQIYEIPFLVQIFQASSVICLIGFNVMVS